MIPVVFIGEYNTTGWLLTAAVVANWLMCIAFATEFVTVTSLTQYRAGYARKAWLDLLINVVAAEPFDRPRTRCLGGRGSACDRVQAYAERDGTAKKK